VLNAFRHHRGGRGVDPRDERGNKLCSTPFGITEVGGGETRFPEGLFVEVLNAFRHHRGGRGPRPGAGTRRRSGAQRLSASQRWAAWSANENSRAFLVLNAFRHHRGGRLPALGRREPGHGCSTPFGITEVGGTSGCPAERAPAVLNAFRHHRGGRDEIAARTAGEERCSTPFGITEVGGRFSGATGTRRNCCAQRLSASQRWAGQRRGTHESNRCVLNAFRHHRGGRPAERRTRRGRSYYVLNAFRHHRGGRTPLPTRSHCTSCKAVFQESPCRRAAGTCLQPGGRSTRVANVYTSSRSS